MRCYQSDRYHTHGTQPVREREEEMEEDGGRKREMRREEEKREKEGWVG